MASRMLRRASSRVSPLGDAAGKSGNVSGETAFVGGFKEDFKDHGKPRLQWVHGELGASHILQRSEKIMRETSACFKM